MMRIKERFYTHVYTHTEMLGMNDCLQHNDFPIFPVHFVVKYKDGNSLKLFVKACKVAVILAMPPLQVIVGSFVFFCKVALSCLELHLKQFC